MRLHQHVIISGAVSGSLYAISGSAPVALFSFISGVFVDIDHLIDYWYQKPFSLNIPDFFSTCNEVGLVKTRLFLHSIEFLPLLGLAAFVFRSELLAAVAIGLAQHYLFDHLYNSAFPFGYFFLFRLKRGFWCERIFAIEPRDGGNGQWEK